METYFAPAERASEADFQADLAYVSSNPVIASLMNAVSGFLAVVNEQRQIVAVNGQLLEMLGAKDSCDLLGLRPGEAAGCIHSHDNMPGGCGTSRHCETCGAAIAMVSALKHNEPQSRICAVATEKNGQKDDLYLMIRALPMAALGRRYMLLFLQDITSQQKLAALTRVFFHDVRNISSALLTAAQLLVVHNNGADKELVKMINDLSERLASEIAMQQSLTQPGQGETQPNIQSVSAAGILESMQRVYSQHPRRGARKIIFPQSVPEVFFKINPHILLRVLDNMVLNALEATPASGRIEVKFQDRKDSVCFSVWNAKEIPPDLALRIFQRNISTKTEMGHGLGTYSMKLIGEQFLGGKVSFTTSADAGTEFSICLPKQT